MVHDVRVGDRQDHARGILAQHPVQRVLHIDHRGRAIGEVLRPLGIAVEGNDGSPGPDAAMLMRLRKWPAIELTQDGTRYFDVHHTVADTLDKINPATLPQNIAAWAAVAWLAAQSTQRLGPLT